VIFRIHPAGFGGLLLSLALNSLPAIAQAVELPQPNATGDYSRRTGHRYWVVVDPDPEGLNCRWSTAMPKNWYDPSAAFPAMDIQNWPVVKRFKRNQALLANTIPAGFAVVLDETDKPWLKVNLGAETNICLVRANAQFIRPYDRE
jgi:hypothetical protein